MKHKLAIITTVYENYTVLEDFLGSLRSQSSQDFHLYITDLSNSKHPIASYEVSQTIIEGKNLGYAHGVNTGIERAIQDGLTYFAVLNDDTMLANDFVEQSLAALKRHPNALIGGKIFYAAGYEYHKKYSKNQLGKVFWYAGGSVDWNHVTTPHRGVDEVDTGQYDKLQEMGFITGCLMCFDKEVWETVGKWNEEYFLYYEDADFCVRATRSNLSLYFDPNIKIWHKNSQSTEGAGSSFQQKYLRRNQLRFGLKYAPFKTKLHLIKNYLLRFDGN